MNLVKAADLSGVFYPSDAVTLADSLTGYLSSASQSGLIINENTLIRALIVPNAPLSYSGRVAGAAFRSLVGRSFSKVIILGGTHHQTDPGIFYPSFQIMQTPLGQSCVNQTMIEKIGMELGFTQNDQPFAEEHSIENCLIFLQSVLTDFTILPLIIGKKIDFDQSAAVLNSLITPRTLLVISSNLSHYLHADQATERDRSTLQSIVELDQEKLINEGQASSLSALALTVAIAKQHQWQPQITAYENSEKVGDDPNSVVGYGSIVFTSENK